MTTATTDRARITGLARITVPAIRSGPVGLAAGVAAGVIGTAAAIAGAPYVDSYGYYDGPGYW